MSVKSEVKKKETKKKQTENDVDITDIEKIRKSLSIPVSDDVMDYLESQVDQLKSTDNLGEKVSIHTKLLEYTKSLEKEIDEMIDMIEKIDYNDVYEDIKNDINSQDTTDVSDDILNLEKIMSKLKEEDVMQIKLLYMKKILDRVRLCKAKCGEHKMTINKCN